MFAPLLLAQTVESGRSAGWLIIGGALAVLGIGVVIVVMARIGSRRNELEARISVRSEAVALADPAPAPSPAPPPRRPSTATFVDLPDTPPGDVVDLREELTSTTEGRRSPLSTHADAVDQQETFVDLPASSQRDPIVDLTEESVDLTDEREEARPKSDPWA